MAQTRDKVREAADGIAYGLGWFSIGLGLAEMLAPRLLGQKLGLDGNEQLIRAYGAREIATGLGLVTAKHRAPWLWGRLGGDVIDLATLGYGLLNSRSHRQKENLQLALVAVAGITVLDLLCAQTLSTTAPKKLPARLLARYRNRSGLPRPPEAMRGIAKDFEVPRDMRIPEALRPYASA